MSLYPCAGKRDATMKNSRYFWCLFIIALAVEEQARGRRSCKGWPELDRNFELCSTDPDKIHSPLHGHYGMLSSVLNTTR